MLPAWAEASLRELIRLAPSIVRAVEQIRGRTDSVLAQVRQLRKDVDALAEAVGAETIRSSGQDAEHDTELDALRRRLDALED